jgi:hypothetical protein
LTVAEVRCGKLGTACVFGGYIFGSKKETGIYFEVGTLLLFSGPYFFRKTVTRGSFLINKHTERLVRSWKRPTRAPDRSESCIRKKMDENDGNNTEKQSDERIE